MVDSGFYLRIPDLCPNANGKAALRINAFEVRGYMRRGGYLELLAYVGNI